MQTGLHDPNCSGDNHGIRRNVFLEIRQLLEVAYLTWNCLDPSALILLANILMCQFVMMCLFYTHWLKIMCEIHLILSCVDLTQFTKCVFALLKCVVFINSLCVLFCNVHYYHTPLSVLYNVLN